MIVKNESHIMYNSILQNIMDHVSCIMYQMIISDNRSTDNTVDIITDFFQETINNNNINIL